MNIARTGKPVLGLSKRACWIVAIAISALTWGGIVFLFAVVAGVRL